jgi:hypothetical protein
MLTPNNGDIEIMREIALELRLSDIGEIEITEFISLFSSLDQLNNLGVEIVNYDNFTSNHIEDFTSDRNQVNNIARIRAISKSSPTIVEIVFASIGAFWILIQMIDKVRTWRLNKETLLMQQEKLKYETELKYIELMEKREEVFKKLNSPSNQDVIEQLANILEQNPLVLESVEIKEERPNTNPQREPALA